MLKMNAVLLMLMGGIGLGSITLGGEVQAEPGVTPIQVAQVTTVKAPTGTYTATLGATTVTRRTVTETGVRRQARNAEGTEGTPISVTIQTYATRAEVNTISAAEDVSAALDQYRMGSMTIRGLVYPINLALSAKVGDNYVISLLSGQAFAGTGPAGRLAQGGGVGYVLLTVPVNGAAGTGRLYTSAQVGVSEQGEIRVLGGGSSATPLTEVQSDEL